jgi:hypothetical protein
VFYSNGFNFSGGFEYGFALTQNNSQYPLIFYYTMNANCNCGGGLPCPSTKQCKTSDSPSGSLIPEMSGIVPLPATIQSGVNYYFHAWIYYDNGTGTYRLKVDVLDQSFNSLCAGQACGNPIDTPFTIPTDFS